MATTNKASHESAQPKFMVTYGTGGVKSPASLRVLSLPKLYRLLRTTHQAETAALNERWHPYTSTTKQVRWRQYKLIETTFPFVVAGTTFDEAAAAADDEDESAGWQTLSGLLVLSFEYPVAKDNEVVTLNHRLRLQNQLLYVPLLGPSIVFICNVPGECRLLVLVAAGPMKDYWARIRTITRYLKAVRPKLDGTLWAEDFVPTVRHSLGYDQYAYLQPRPAEGYALFPVKEAQTKTAEYERLNKHRKNK